MRQNKRKARESSPSSAASHGAGAEDTMASVDGRRLQWSSLEDGSKHQMVRSNRNASRAPKLVALFERAEQSGKDIPLEDSGRYLLPIVRSMKCGI